MRVVIAERFLEHLPELEIALGTGMRLSEQFGLTWDAVNFKRREVRLGTAKNYTGRSIPMNTEVLGVFKKLRETAARDSMQVFSIINPRAWFEEALRLAKIKRFRWHDRRQPRLRSQDRPLKNRA